MMRLFVLCLTATFLSVLMLSPAFAAAADQLEAAFNTMFEPSLDTTLAYDISDLELTHRDFTLSLDSGTLYLCAPIALDSGLTYWGGLFAGKAKLEFAPPVRLEKQQMQRFFKSDSISQECQVVHLIFGQEHFDRIRQAGDPIVPEIKRSTRSGLSMCHDYLVKDEKRAFIFRALKALAFASGEPYLLVNTELKKRGQVVYEFYPYRSEEIAFYRHYWEIGVSGFLELVSRYSIYADESCININGMDKRQLTTNRFAIETTIDDRGTCFCAATADYLVVRPTQMVAMTLHPFLTVDSIFDGDHNPVSFLRWEKKKHRSSGLFLLFDRMLKATDSLTLTFYYHGEVAERFQGEFIVSAGADWYPRYGYRQRATFDLTFKSPQRFGFVATGRKQSERIVGDTLVTRWLVELPSVNVSFSIGHLEVYSPTLDSVPPVDVYYNKSLHVDFAFDRNEEKQVADDVVNSLKLYQHYFGPYLFSRLSVSEILMFHGEAFPGLLHLSLATFASTDTRQQDRRFRAHEVAHQWWGAAVGYASYHDRWLSEGFAEYSALMLIQAAAGNEEFFRKLRKYRDDIYSVRTYTFSDGPEAGPIIMGYRTSSTRTPGDQSLIIYRKAALVLHMLRNMLLDLDTMNEDLFLRMMREWYSTNKGKDPTTLDFRLLTEKYTGAKMDWFFEQYVYGNDLPTYDFTYAITPGIEGATIDLRIEQRDVPEGWQMYVPLEIEFANGYKYYLRLLVDQPVNELSIPNIEGTVKSLTLNPFESVLAKVKTSRVDSLE